MKSLRHFTNNKLIRNVAIVATGTTGAHMIGIAFTPLITRIYGPEAFGQLGAFKAVLSIVTPIAALTYPIAIVLPQSDSEAASIAKLSVCITLITSFIAFVLFLLAAAPIAKTLNVEALTNYLILIPLAMLIVSINDNLNNWTLRKKQFSLIAKAALIENLIINLFKLGVGYKFPFGFVLLIFATIAKALNTLILSIGISHKAPLLYRGYQTGGATNVRSDAKALFEIAKKYSEFPKYRAPQVFLNGISQSLPVIALASLFGPIPAGFYTLGRMVLAMPSALIGKAVGDVFYPRLAEAANNNENLFNLTYKATLALAIVGFVPFATIISLGPLLFSFFFGNDWEVAGIYSSWLGLWLYAMFVNTPSIKALPVLKAQRFHLFFSLGAIGLRVLALYVGFLYVSDVLAIALFSITGAMLNIFLIFLVLIMCRNYRNAPREK